MNRSMIEGEDVDDETEVLNRTRHPFVRFENLSKKFGSYKAIDNLNLHLFEDSVSCLIGHNGAGKTTAINLLIGLLKPSMGTIQVLSNKREGGTQQYHDVVADINKIRLKLGLCQQHDILFD